MICERLLEDIPRARDMRLDHRAGRGAVFAANDWPGNVREGRNVPNAAAMAPDEVPAGIIKVMLKSGSSGDEPLRCPLLAQPCRNLVRAEREAILEALRQVDGQERVRRRLGVSRSQFYEKSAVTWG